MPSQKVITSKNLLVLLTWFTYAIALLPIVPYNVNSITMISWAFLSICYYFSKEKSERIIPRSGIKLFIIYGGNYVLLLISLLYSRDVQNGVETLIALLPMLFFPFIIFLFHMDELVTRKNIQTIFLVFWASTLLLCGWLIFRYFQLDLFRQFDTSDSFNNPFRLTSERLIGIHPTYFSLFLGFSIYVAGFNFLKTRNIFLKLLLAFSILLFTFHLISLASRTPLLAIFLALIIITILKIKKPFQRILVALTLTILTFLLIRFTPSIYSRLIEVQQTAITVPIGDQYNSTNIRVGILKCSWEIIEKSPLFGTGIGSEKKLLTACYSQFNTDGYKKTYYNSHNQYLFFGMMGGIVSFLLFLYSLFYTIALSVKTKDYMMLYFIIMLSLTFLTENLLSSHAGLVFYYFFLSLMVGRHMPAIIKPSINSN